MAIAAGRLYVYGNGYLAAFQLSSQAQPDITSVTRKRKAIVEMMKVQKLSVFASPNPATTHFVLRLQGSSPEPVQIRVMDAMGKTVEWRRNVAANSTLKIGDTYRSGLYFAEVIQGAEKIITKLVKGAK
jgi:hypothetical protein